MTEIQRKYQAAFDEMDRRGIRVTDARPHGSKLYVLAWARTDEDKNRVWDVIKQIDPSYSDLIMDIRIGSPEEVEQEFEQYTRGSQPQALASGLTEAFRSDRTPPFADMLAQMFSQSNSSQRSGLLNSILGGAGGGLAGGLLGNLLGGGRSVSPDQLDRLSPEQVRELAARAEREDPSIIERASDFYAQHPTLIKALGAGALGILMTRVKGGKGGGFF